MMGPFEKVIRKCRHRLIALLVSSMPLDSCDDTELSDTNDNGSATLKQCRHNPTISCALFMPSRNNF